MSTLLRDNETSLFGVFLGFSMLGASALSYISTPLLVLFLGACFVVAALFEAGVLWRIRVGSSDSILVKYDTSILTLFFGVASLITYVLYQSSVPFMLAFLIFSLIFVFIYTDFVDGHKNKKQLYKAAE
jgi:hypothetical protein